MADFQADLQAVIDRIVSAFESNAYPGDRFLQGSRDGCEPYEETSAFAGQDWRGLESAFLDAHYSALSFFSARLPPEIKHNAWLLANRAGTLTGGRHGCDEIRPFYAEGVMQDSPGLAASFCGLPWVVGSAGSFPEREKQRKGGDTFGIAVPLQGTQDQRITGHPG